MAVLILARRDQHLVAFKGRRRDGASVFEHGTQAVTRRLKLGALLANQHTPQNRSGGLAKRASFDILCKLGDRPSFTTTSTVTVDPHRGERFFALPIGAESRP